MGPFGTGTLTPGGALLQDAESGVQVVESVSVLLAGEATVTGDLVEVEAVDGGGDHGLHEGTVRFLAVVTPAQRTVLPRDAKADTTDRAACRVAVVVEEVERSEGLKHGLSVDPQINCRISDSIERPGLPRRAENWRASS